MSSSFHRLSVTAITTLALGALAACGDDTTAGGDATACPPAEPPLAGRIVRVRATGLLDPQGVGIAGAGCNGGTLLGGSCRLAEGDRDIALSEAGADLGGAQLYFCQWNSSSNRPNTPIAEAICLMPAP